MILYPNAKINIGLEVLRMRPDGFHDIETIFYPLNWCDLLEIIPSRKFSFSESGMLTGVSASENIAVKAYRLMHERYSLPPVAMHLHKQIPSGAGLGGGSSDAAHVLMGLNQLFDLQIDQNQLLDMAAQLGSDCPFFIINEPVLAEGRGEMLTKLTLDLKGWHLLVVKPAVHVSTADAYRNVHREVPGQSLRKRIMQPVAQWKSIVDNKFEKSVFDVHPEIAAVKKKMYSMGAVYASMSGSGAAVYALFSSLEHNVAKHFENCTVWHQPIK
ncbi:4-(cytidine 5'-diphospho)-2-C-methyl-D-erythritol kinase [Roseimarinus sediminis]|uniref:4-(cytidine 5'-diphospho)-2-C-methyl-D-erythritol kinase n=1 Tax=Roseimarinus sediminis TaxID=1610899 RepID=UPI003D24292A